MALLNKVIENKRDEYMINVLEEGTTELESLKTKKYLTENLHMIGKILMEEGVVDAAKQNLANNWGKYAAGAGVAAGTGLAIAHPEATAGYVAQGLSAVGADAETTANATKGTFDALQGAQDTIISAGETIKDEAGNIYDKAGNLLHKAGENIEAGYQDAKANVEANPAAYAAGAGALGGAALGAGGMYLANRNQQRV